MSENSGASRGATLSAEPGQLPSAVMRVLAGVSPQGLDRVATGLRAMAAGVGEQGRRIGLVASGTPASTWSGQARTVVLAEAAALAGQLSKAASLLMSAADAVTVAAAGARSCQDQMNVLRRQWQVVVAQYEAGGFGPRAGTPGARGFFGVLANDWSGTAAITGAYPGSAETRRGEALLPLAARIAAVEDHLRAVFAQLAVRLAACTPVELPVPAGGLGAAAGRPGSGGYGDLIDGSAFEAALPLTHRYRAEQDALTVIAALTAVRSSAVRSSAVGALAEIAPLETTASRLFAARAGDRLFAAALAREPAAPAGLLRVQQGPQPPAGWARTVNRWWAALDPQHRDRLIAAPEPAASTGPEKIAEIEASSAAVIGALGGISARDRSAANSRVLAAELPALTLARAQLQAELERQGQIEDGVEMNGAPLARQRAILEEIDRIDGVLSGASTLSRLLRYPGQGQVQVLNFDSRKVGHAVVAFGDPDTATDTITYVPGLSSTLQGCASDLQRAELVGDQARLRGTAHTVSSIYWLGYDAPQLSVDSVLNPDTTAVMDHAAATGAPALQTFSAGLSGSHDPSVGSHRVMLGHSYGSLVIGQAARAGQPGSLADDLIFVGSPGVGVDHAGDLRVGAGHVYAAEGLYDPVPKLPAAKDLVSAGAAMAREAWRLATQAWDGMPPRFESPFGANVTDPSFGAKVFTVDVSPIGRAHSDYWNPERHHSASLRNLAAITVAEQPT